MKEAVSKEEQVYSLSLKRQLYFALKEDYILQLKEAYELNRNEKRRINALVAQREKDQLKVSKFSLDKSLVGK